MRGGDDDVIAADDGCGAGAAVRKELADCRGLRARHPCRDYRQDQGRHEKKCAPGKTQSGDHWCLLQYVTQPYIPSFPVIRMELAGFFLGPWIRRPPFRRLPLQRPSLLGAWRRRSYGRVPVQGHRFEPLLTSLV